MNWKSYLRQINEGKHDVMLMTHKNIVVNINIKNSENISHVEDRLKSRSGLTLDQFKEKLKSVVDSVKASGTYIAVLKKSKIKIPFKYTKSKNDLYIFTILSMDMVEKDFDYKIDLNEYVFEVFGVNIKNNDYLFFEQGHHNVIQFMIEENVKSFDGIELIEIEV